jgi:hypothetical protein
MSNQTGPKSGSRDCQKQSSTNKKVKSQDEAEDPWWINSPEHDHCFWNFVNEKSGPDGSMPELVQSEIADLMGWSNTKTHFMLKTAMAELIEALKTAQAQELLSQNYEEQVGLPEIDPVPVGQDDSNE